MSGRRNRWCFGWRWRLGAVGCQWFGEDSRGGSCVLLVNVFELDVFELDLLLFWDRCRIGVGLDLFDQRWTAFPVGRFKLHRQGG